RARVEVAIERPGPGVARDRSAERAAAYDVVVRVRRAREDVALRLARNPEGGVDRIVALAVVLRAAAQRIGDLLAARAHVPAVRAEVGDGAAFDLVRRRGVAGVPSA